MDLLFDYEANLGSVLARGLQSLPGVHVQGITAPDAMDRRVPTVSFTVDGVSPDVVAEELGARNIFVWSGDMYAIEVTKLLGVEDSGGVVRIGPVHYNSEDEVNSVLSALADILPRAAVA
jgi:selenocysteine lyase/cysteine desulfurase